MILQDLCVNTGSVTTYCSVYPEKACVFYPCRVQCLEVCVIRAAATQPSMFCSGIMPAVFSGTASVLNDHGTFNLEFLFLWGNDKYCVFSPYCSRGSSSHADPSVFLYVSQNFASPHWPCSEGWDPLVMLLMDPLCP